MASDDFNGTDNTALFTHNSDWGYMGGETTEPEIFSNTLRPDGTFDVIRVRYTTSTEDYCQAVFKGNATLNIRRAVHVRSSSSARGYEAALANVSGTDYTRIDISKNGTYQDSINSLTIDGTVDQTVRITAEDDATDVIVRVYVDGIEQGSWTDTADVIASGNPGLYQYANGGGQAEVAIDDWTDGAGAVAAALKTRIDIEYNRRVTG